MGSLYSINFPTTTNYSNNYEEHYVITVEDGAKISLYFENFDLEYHISCIYDYIEGKGSGTMDGTMVLKQKHSPIKKMDVHWFWLLWI